MASGLLEFTLVTAVECSWGIGYLGNLPWSLEKELKYFTRVTKSTPPNDTITMNAVIMGRKTWDAHPPIVQPLPDRINVVITRSPETFWRSNPSAGSFNQTYAVTSLENAIKLLQVGYMPPNAKSRGGIGVKVGKVFVIGGAEIYGDALRMPQTTRLLLTWISADFKCDVFFPGYLLTNGWSRQSHDRMKEWVGCDIPTDVQRENGVEYECMMYERDFPKN